MAGGWWDQIQVYRDCDLIRSSASLVVVDCQLDGVNAAGQSQCWIGTRRDLCVSLRPFIRQGIVVKVARTRTVQSDAGSVRPHALNRLVRTRIRKRWMVDDSGKTDACGEINRRMCNGRYSSARSRVENLQGTRLRNIEFASI